MTTTYNIAEEVKDLLNAQAGPSGIFGRAFTAVRSYLPTSSQADLEDWRVTVAPISYEENNQERNSVIVEHTVHVGVQKNLEYEDNTTMDDANDFVVLILGFLRRIDLVTNVNIITRNARIMTIADPEDMREGTFTSVVELVFWEKIVI